jgi:hypothetical protein
MKQVTIPIIYDPVSPYARCGMDHFKSKYGVLLDPVGTESARAWAEVSAGSPKDRIVSWKDTEYGSMPFFEEIAARPLEIRGGRLIIHFNVFESVGRILSGSMDSMSPADKEKTSRIPIVDIYESMVFSALANVAKKQGQTIPAKPFWPDGKKFAVCLTHDIDETRKNYQYLTHALSFLRRGKITHALREIVSLFTDFLTGKKPYWTFDSIMNLEESLGVRSSFYFLQDQGNFTLTDTQTWKIAARKYRFSDPEISNVMRRLHSGGWEIGLHGSFFSSGNKELLAGEKRALESALGSPVSGTRQHHLLLRIPETWKYHEGSGLSYDTSLGFKDRSGFRWGTCFPFHPFDAPQGKSLDLLELPLAVMDTTLLKKDPKEAWKEISGMIDIVERQGGLLVVLFHHTVYDADEYPGWSGLYKKMVSAVREKDAWISTADGVDRWWRGGANVSDA